MHHTQDIKNELCAHNGYHLCWSAIIAGALVGLGLGFLLHLYSLAIGLTAFNATSGTMTITIGGVIGLIIGSVVAMTMAGFTAGYLGHALTHGMGVLYGFTTWSLALILSAVMIIPMNHYVSAVTASLAPSVFVETQRASNEKMVSIESPNNQLAKVTSASTVTISSWIVFFLFIIGALSSCLGAWAAIACHLKHCSINEKSVTPIV